MVRCCSAPPAWCTHLPPTHPPTPAVPTPPQGSIPKISDLPAPWGPKPFTPAPAEELVTSGYLPPTYPEGWSPLTDVDVGAA